MHRSRLLLAGLTVGAAVAARVVAGDFCSCTGGDGCPECVPACKATWDEHKTPGKPTYALKCEYACARGRDPWHAPDPECRCSPPCGKVFVKKRLYKEAGAEKVERVPKYEVVNVPAACGHGHASWWGRLCDWCGW